MWHEGTIRAKTESVKFWVKAYDEPSEEYGIDGGCISKLSLKINSEWTANYDRGWDIESEDEASQLAFAILIKEYN